MARSMVIRVRPRSWGLPLRFLQPGFLRRWREKRGRRSLYLESLEDRVLPTTFNWTSLTDGNWNDPANWNGGGVALPGAGDGGVINVSGITITHSAGTDSIKSLTFATPFNDSILDISGGSLAISSSSSISDTLRVSSTGTLSLGAALTVSSTGTVNWTGGTLTGSGS